MVGTVYKDMKLKPSILDEYVKVHNTQRTASVTKGLLKACTKLDMLVVSRNVLPYMLVLVQTFVHANFQVYCRIEGLHSWLGGLSLLELMTASYWKMRVHA